MLRWLRQRAETSRKAEELYGSVVTAARQPDFYGALGVPDTPEGRFELVALHLFLALEGLRGQGAAAEGLARRAIETFVVDMDDCMREMGVGDLTVPKKVKRAAAAFYESITRASPARTLWKQFHGRNSLRRLRRTIWLFSIRMKPVTGSRAASRN